MSDNLLDNAKAQEANVVLPTANITESARRLWNMMLASGIARQMRYFYENKFSHYPDRYRDLYDIYTKLKKLSEIMASEVNEMGPKYVRKFMKEFFRQPNGFRSLRQELRPERNNTGRINTYEIYPDFGTGYSNGKKSFFTKFGLDPYETDLLNFKGSVRHGMGNYDLDFVTHPEDGDRYSPWETVDDLMKYDDRAEKFYETANTWNVLGNLLDKESTIDREYDGTILDFIKQNIGSFPMMQEILKNRFNKALDEKLNTYEKYAYEPSFKVESDPLMALEGPFSRIFGNEWPNVFVSGEKPKYDDGTNRITDYILKNMNRFGFLGYPRMYRDEYEMAKDLLPTIRSKAEED